MPHQLARLRPSVVGGVAVLCGLLVVGVTSSHDGASGREGTIAIADLVPDESLDPRILQLEFEGARWASAVTGLEQAISARDEALERRDEAVSRLIEVRRGRTPLVERLHQVEAEAATLDDQIDRHEEALRQRAVEHYVSFGDASDLDAIQSSGTADAARSRQLAEEVGAAQIDRWRELRAREVVIGHEVATLEGQIAALDRAEEETASTARRASADLAAARVAVDSETAAVHAARRTARVAGFDLPVIGLDAYLRAATATATIHPSCELPWWLLAAIGRVESHHGELGGRRLDENGDVSRPIIGMALDGRPGIRAVVDTDGGTHDGDPVWDRALGPMQFIPETWSRRGVDGNQDGVTDAQNIYDAAATAADHLCDGGAPLGTHTGRRDALLGYNTSDAYVEEIETWARTYRRLVVPTAYAP